MHMSDRVVTLKTTSLEVGIGRMRFNRPHNLLMTLPASSFRYFAPVCRDLNVVWEPASGEVVGMPEPVPRFGRVFTNKVWRSVTVVTNGDGPVA